MVGLIGWWVFAGGWMVSCESMISGSEKMVWWDLSSKKKKNVRAMTEQFCTMVSAAKCTHDGNLFDANQSVFTTLLCDNVWMGELFTGIVRIWEESVLMKTWFEQFGIYDYGFLDDSEWTDINFCDYRVNYMNGCNYAEHLPKMFDEIMNDFFNIKQADLYGVDKINEDVPAEDLANNFSKKNFQGLTSQKWLEQWICDPNSEYYGGVCKYLKNYMKDVRNLLNKTNVINILKLSDWKSKDYCMTNFDNDILYCGLLWDDITPEQSFLTAIYNEYLWYRLFISYYSYELSVESEFSELIDWDGIEKMNWNRDKIYSFQEKMGRSRQAVSVALRSLSEISSSFPLHVWFLMYQEDAKIFMKKLSKLYPPIMTLFDKLRNVQRVD